MMKERHAVCLLITSILGQSVIYLGQEGKNILVIALISILLFLPFLYLFFLIHKRCEYVDIFHMLGKGIISSVLSIVLMILALLSASYLIFIYKDFLIQTQIYKGSLLFFYCILIIALLMILRCHDEAIGRISQIAFFMIFFLSVIVFLLSIDEMNPSYILPIRYSSSNYFLFLPILFENLLILNFIDGSSKRVLFGGYLGAFFLIISYLFMMISLLGDELIMLMNFPLFSAMSVINFMDFFNRIEVIGILIFFLSFIFKTIMLIRSINIGLSYYIGKRKYYITVFLAGFLSLLIPNSLVVKEIISYHSIITVCIWIFIMIYLIFKTLRAKTPTNR